MTNLYRIPCLEVPAQVVVVSRESHQVTLFLSEAAETHRGPERPSDILNARGVFLPARGRAGMIIFNLDAVMVVGMAAETEFGAPDVAVLDGAAGQVTHRRVRIGLEDGTPVLGELTYLLPEGQQRVQDFLNGPGRFIALHSGSLVKFVNKKRIAWVCQD